MVAQIARESFIDYCIAIDKKYQDSWFHETLANILQTSVEKLERGESVRIILVCPPRHGKSNATTEKLPSWVLGKHPDWPIIVTSYSAELASEFGQATRDLVNSEEYQKIFKTKLRQDTKAKGRWMTKEGGGYTAVGVGGAITGKGFKIGIIDDPFKNREEADSETVRNSRWNWYKSTFYTRQEGVSAIIVIMTRWHTDDIVGRLEEEEQKAIAEGATDYDQWNKIIFPAVATQDESRRKKGEALWPEKFPLESLRTTERALGPYDWASLYQGSPITSETQEFKQEWIKYRTWEEVSALRTRKFATIDPGGKKEENDFTGIIRNYVDGQNNWNIKSLGVHIDSKELLDHIFMLHDEGFEDIGIEETVYLKAVQPFYDEECRRRNKFPHTTPIKQPSMQKEVRIRGLIPRYASGSVYHIVGQVKTLEDQMRVFPKGANDDEIDALAMQNEIAKPPHNEIAALLVKHDRERRRNEVAQSYGL